MKKTNMLCLGFFLRYIKGSKKQKGLILTEVVSLTGYHRKHVRKQLLNPPFKQKFKTIRDIIRKPCFFVITKVILKGGLEVEVKGRIPLFPKERSFASFTLNMGYGTTSRSSQSGNQLNNLASEIDYRIPYELIIELPKPRYERNIIERDNRGRIIHSTPPTLESRL